MKFIIQVFWALLQYLFSFVYVTMNTYTTIEEPYRDDTIFTKDHWHHAWTGPGSMQQIILAEGWTEIGEKAFEDDKELQYIVIPKSVVEISDGAFMGADNLEEVIFEYNSQIAEISEDAFVKSSLKRVVIHQKALDTLNKNIFDINSENIGSLDVESFHTFREIPKLQFGIDNYFYGRQGVEIIMAPAAYITIPYPYPGREIDPRFTKDIWIASGSPENVILAEGWTEIGMFAFKDASELQTISIPASVVTIDVQAFVNAINLRQVEFADRSRLHTIKTDAFSHTIALERINIPASVEVIAVGAFQGSGLREVTFENGLRLDRIGNHVFAMTKFLQRINIPASVKVIENETFQGSGLREVTFANGSRLERIGNQAFAMTRSLQRINIPASVKVIGQSAFFETLNLTEVSFEQNSNITNIDPYAFSDSGLTLVTIGETALNRLNYNNPRPLHFGPNNNFYGKENVTIVSRSQQFDSLMFSMRKGPGIADDLTRRVAIHLMKEGVEPKSPAALAARVKALAPNAGTGGRKSRTKKRGIRRKSIKTTTRRRRRHKNKSRRRRSRIV